MIEVRGTREVRKEEFITKMLLAGLQSGQITDIQMPLVEAFGQLFEAIQIESAKMPKDENA